MNGKAQLKGPHKGMNTRICIAGGAGRMGSWFASYFKRKGHEVLIYDIDKRRLAEVSTSLGVRPVGSLQEADADIYLVSVPPKKAPGVISTITRLSSDQHPAIVEITSVKSAVIRSLRRAARRGIQVLSIHPMFGPNVREISKEMTILVKINDAKTEIAFAKSILPDFHFIAMNASKHDELTSFTLSLTHFLNIAFGLSLARMRLSELIEASGASFTLQLSTLRHVMSSGDEAIIDTMACNPTAVRAIRAFVKASCLMLNFLQTGETQRMKGTVSRCRSILHYE